MGGVGWFGGGDGLGLRLVVLRRIPVIDWLGDFEFQIGWKYSSQDRRILFSFHSLFPILETITQQAQMWSEFYNLHATVLFTVSLNI